jgi:serine/threonine protein kinase
MKQIIEGVAKLHNLQIAHRDLKSQNIFIKSNGDAIIGDFGLASRCNIEGLNPP